MEGLIERCAGVDVHQATLVVTVRLPDGSGGRHVETRTFGAMTVDLLTVRDWLQACGSRMSPWRAPASIGSRSTTCSKTASRCCWSTCKHLKQVPGRKTDVKDSAWLAQLLECGLLRGSLVPPPPSAISGSDPVSQEAD